MRLPLHGDGEAIVADLARREVESYRQLPRLLFQMVTRLRGESPGAASLFRPREANTVEAYSLHMNEASLGQVATEAAEAFRDLFSELEVEADLVEAGLGPAPAAEGAFILRHPQGDSPILRCGQCGYAALVEAASSDPGPGVPGEALPLEKVATPGCHTIADLARYLNLDERQTLKAVFYTRQEDDLVFAVIRGDLDVNEAKLVALAGGPLRPAASAEIEAVGAAPGYASPAGLRVRRPEDAARIESRERRETREILVVADPSIESGGNFAAGANEAGYHFVNVNYPRDFAITLMADIAQARAGQACVRCGAPLRAERGMELGRVARHNTHYSVDEAGNARVTALDPNGKPQPLWLGAYRLDLDRLVGAVIETHHDDAGIVWPAAIAPFDVHIVSLLKAGDEAERLYAELVHAGCAVLLDDRPESAGVKFADADLIGCPVRLTLSDRSLKAGGVEWKRRASAEREVVALEAVRARLAAGARPAARPGSGEVLPAPLPQA
jgi:prolyl-tRNA synthetase